MSALTMRLDRAGSEGRYLGTGAKAGVDTIGRHILSLRVEA